jgi:hypothetical protein
VRSSERQRHPRAAREGAPVQRAPDTAAERVLALQRSAGNAAVARRVRALQRGGWGEAREGGWNKDARPVAGTQRLVIKGLKQGYHKTDTGASTPTSEKAGEKNSGRAIVIVPDGTDFSTKAKLEVLLVLHGMGESAGIGYRERTSADQTGGEGTVHDVEADVIPQQLSSSGRNMVAILAQGKSVPGDPPEDRFGISDTAAYVTDVLAKMKTELAALKPPVTVPDNLTPYRIVSAGHSGGGPQAVASADALQGGDWHRSAPLFLFDAINGPIELKTLRGTLKRWLETDLAHLTAAADPGAELAKRGLKFRSTYSTDSHERYVKNHESGDYEINKKPVKITKAESLNGFLDAWFAANATGKLAPFAKAWKDQYATEKVSGSHHYQIGARGKAKKRDAVPAELKGASKREGVPVYDKDSGNLEKSLKGLPSDALRPPPPAPHAEFEEELEDDPGKVFA